MARRTREEINHLKALGLDASSSEEDIKKAYRKLALQYHPDKNKEPDALKKFEKIQDAYNYLMKKEEKTYIIELQKRASDKEEKEAVREERNKKKPEGQQKVEAEARKKREALMVSSSYSQMLCMGKIIH